MSKSTKVAKTTATAPVKTPVQAPAPTVETKTARDKRVDRPTCLAARSAMRNTDRITAAKPYDGRPGTLRANIVSAIQGAATVWDACKIEVNGPGKYEVNGYRIKKVDIGFALANGYITLEPAE